MAEAALVRAAEAGCAAKEQDAPVAGRQQMRRGLDLAGRRHLVPVWGVAMRGPGGQATRVPDETADFKA
jgi:hypothetical protein